MDLDLTFRIFQRYPVAYIDEVVFYYRRHSGNTSGNQERRLTENISVIRKLLAENPQAEITLGQQRVASRLAYRYYRLAKGLWKKGRQVEAQAAIDEASRLCPWSLKYRFYRLRWGVLKQSRIMDFSIVIATYDRWELLRGLLSSIREHFDTARASNTK